MEDRSLEGRTVCDLLASDRNDAVRCVRLVMDEMPFDAGGTIRHGPLVNVLKRFRPDDTLRHEDEGERAENGSRERYSFSYSHFHILSRIPLRGFGYGLGPRGQLAGSFLLSGPSFRGFPRITSRISMRSQASRDSISACS